MQWSTLWPMPNRASAREPFDNIRGVQQITNLFETVHVAAQKQNPEMEHLDSIDAIYQSLGFKLSIKPSSLPGAGNGVYLKGVREQGEVVSLYPGTLKNSIYCPPL